MNQVAVTMRERVEALQLQVLAQPQYEPPTDHLFHGGLYCRKVEQAEGSLVVGKVHLKEHLFALLAGTMLITSGGEAEEMTAPRVLPSMPGTKRVLFALTDAVYMTVHRTDNTTIAAVEDEVVEPDPTSLFTVGNKLKLKELPWHS